MNSYPNLNFNPRFGSAVGAEVGSIRSMNIHPYNTIKNALWVTNAGENEDDVGRILVFDTCAEVNGMRSYLKTLVNVKTNPGAQVRVRVRVRVTT
jgi:hypothetical protein